MDRALRGALAWHSGQAAEAQVAAHYRDRGYDIAAERWRGTAGEIDLIARKDGEVVFIEVKHAPDAARAAESLQPRQQGRIYATAAEFLAGEPQGQDTPCRFDVALVDGTGRIEIIENAFGQG